MPSQEPHVRDTKSTEALELPSDIERIVGGRYELVDKLGEGGFAIVYKARHTELRDLFYAIKILRGEHAGQAEVIKKFRHEAVLLSSLRCPQTVRVMDFGVTNGSPYFVMEFVTGVSLETLLTRHGKLPAAMVARLSMDILESLAEAHTARIVHRDIKPANVLVIEGFGGGPARAKVLDFGIAKVLANEDDAAALANQTVGDFIFCTPLYAPPEVLRRQAQPQSDLYSLAHMMAEALDGRAPYASDVPVMSAHQHLQGGVIPLGPDTELSPLAAIIRRAAEAKVEDRYPTAAAMLADLRRVLPQLVDEAEPALFVRRDAGGAPSVLADSEISLAQRDTSVASLPTASAAAGAADSATRLGWEQRGSSTPLGAAPSLGRNVTAPSVEDPTRTPATSIVTAEEALYDDETFAQPRSTGRNVALGAAAGVAVAAVVAWFALSGDRTAAVVSPDASAGSAEAAAPSPAPVAAPAVIAAPVPPSEPKHEGSAQAAPAPAADTTPTPEPVRTARTKKAPVATKPAPAATPAPAPTPVAAPAPPPTKAPEPPAAEPRRPVLKERKPLFVPD